MKLVVGLGNPGAEYRETRHNVGFQVIDELARRWDAGHWRDSFESLVVKTVRDGEPVLLCKPLTFMNLSGRAVAGVAGWFALAGRISVGELITVVGLAAFIADPVLNLAGSVFVLSVARASAGRLAEALAAPDRPGDRHLRRRHYAAAAGALHLLRGCDHGRADRSAARRPSELPPSWSFPRSRSREADR